MCRNNDIHQTTVLGITSFTATFHCCSLTRETSSHVFLNESSQACTLARARSQRLRQGRSAVKYDKCNNGARTDDPELAASMRLLYERPFRLISNAALTTTITNDNWARVPMKRKTPSAAVDASTTESGRIARVRPERCVTLLTLNDVTGIRVTTDTSNNCRRRSLKYRSSLPISTSHRWRSFARLPHTPASGAAPSSCITHVSIKEWRRCEFRVFHDGEESYYVMFESDGDSPTPKMTRMDTFPVASVLINELMQALLEHVHRSPILRRRLYTAAFHTTLSGSAMERRPSSSAASDSHCVSTDHTGLSQSGGRSVEGSCREALVRLGPRMPCLPR